MLLPACTPEDDLPILIRELVIHALAAYDEWPARVEIVTNQRVKDDAAAAVVRRVRDRPSGRGAEPRGPYASTHSTLQHSFGVPPSERFGASWNQEVPQRVARVAGHRVRPVAELVRDELDDIARLSVAIDAPTRWIGARVREVAPGRRVAKKPQIPHWYGSR